MTEPKWTPGEWRRISLPDDWELGGPERGSFDSICIGVGDQIIATVYGEYLSDDALPGNADLLTGAAGLYLAARAARERMESLCAAYPDDGWSKLVLAALRSALAAAGERP